VAIESERFDAEMTVNLVGELPMPGRDDLDSPTVQVSADAMKEVDSIVLQRKHLRGLLEALVFAADSPIKPPDLAKLAHAPQKLVKELLVELQQDYATRGMHLDEVAGGWCFRTSPQYAPFVRDLTKQKPVRLTRAQVETLAIIAYRQPITRPEVDEVRGVDTGPVMKLLLERDLVRILGKRDEPGRPMIYGTTGNFLEFFGLKSLKDLPTLREFTELSDESRDAYEEELGDGGEDGEAAGHEDDNESAGEYDGGASEKIVEPSEDQLEALAELERLENAEDEDDKRAPHAADDDGPTISTEAPSESDEAEG
jgi:segregation and condensation protein B